jgi:HEAT repeat protein
LWYIIKALGNLGDDRAVKDLFRIYQKSGPWIRWVIIETLGKIASPLCIEPLAAALEDNDSDVKWEASRALENTLRKLRS